MGSRFACPYFLLLGYTSYVSPVEQDFVARVPVWELFWVGASRMEPRTRAYLPL